MFPVNLKLAGKTVLVVGSGRVGRRKLIKLLAAGAKVVLAEPRPAAEISALAETGELLLVSEFTESLLEGAALAFAAANDHEANRRVAEAARARGVPVNVADDPDASDFFLPAVVEWGEFQLTVGTGGASPALAAVVAAELREKYGPEYGRLTALLKTLRPAILSSGLEAAERENLFKRLVESDKLLQLLTSGDKNELNKYIQSILTPLGGNWPSSALNIADKGGQTSGRATCAVTPIS